MKLTKQERRKEQYLDLFILSILGLIVFLCFHWRFILWGGFYCLGWSSHYSAVGEVVVKSGAEIQNCRIFMNPSRGWILIGPYRFEDNENTFTDFIFLARDAISLRSAEDKNEGDWATFLSHLFIILDLSDNDSWSTSAFAEYDVTYRGKDDTLCYKIHRQYGWRREVEFEFPVKFFREKYRDTQPSR